MKYNIGDMILVKDIHPRPPPRPAVSRRLRPRLHPRLKNTLGIITEVEKDADIFVKDSTEKDNGYIWYSQVDGKEYYFYEDEVDGEVIE